MNKERILIRRAKLNEIHSYVLILLWYFSAQKQLVHPPLKSRLIYYFYPKLENSVVLLLLFITANTKPAYQQGQQTASEDIPQEQHGVWGKFSTCTNSVMVLKRAGSWGQPGKKGKTNKPKGLNTGLAVFRELKIHVNKLERKGWWRNICLWYPALHNAGRCQSLRASRQKPWVWPQYYG